MTTEWMNTALFDALREAGAGEETARKAAAAAATPDSLAERIDGLHTKINIVMWVLGTSFAVLFAIGLMNTRWLWSIAMQLPRLS